MIVHILMKKLQSFCQNDTIKFFEIKTKGLISHIVPLVTTYFVCMIPKSSEMISISSVRH